MLDFIKKTGTEFAPPTCLIVIITMLIPSALLAEQPPFGHYKNNIIHHSGNVSLSMQLRNEMGDRWYQQMAQEAHHYPRFHRPAPRYQMRPNIAMVSPQFVRPQPRVVSNPPLFTD